MFTPTIVSFDPSGLHSTITSRIVSHTIILPSSTGRFDGSKKNHGTMYKERLPRRQYTSYDNKVGDKKKQTGLVIKKNKQGW
jgi:hypothetical protein